MMINSTHKKYPLKCISIIPVLKTEIQVLSKSVFERMEVAQNQVIQV